MAAIVIGLALLAGLWLLPDLTPPDAVPVIGQTSLHGRITEELEPDASGAPRFAVEVVSGPEAGTTIEAIVQDGSSALPGSADRDPYRVGDDVVVTRFEGAAGGFAVISEPWRLPVLGLLAAIFAFVVVLVGGTLGIRSLIALGFTLGVVVKLVVPLLLRGVDPILLAVVGGAGVTSVTLLLTEGASRITLASIAGVSVALLLTAALAAAFTGLAEFTALQGSEEIAFLIPLIGDRVDLGGILLAATVFGALGVLDDVSVTQAATVEQIHQTRPDADRGQVASRAMHVGRSHIGATVNTLVLAYLGVGLPLLLLFALSADDPLMVLNSEIVAVEVIRALVGSIGIVAAVPLTTAIAAWLIVRG
ncbi:MAG TPA: YibE/F family protein, partial [Candidatus Limnocylindria bacterium]